MAHPKVPINVDPETGKWSTDGLPMIYMPRHFFVNNHLAVEATLGRELYAKQLYGAGHKSAWDWCEEESITHQIAGIDVFYHYMKRISQRGWGQFTPMHFDDNTGSCDVRLEHSVFVEHCGTDTGRKLCYMYSGWFAGSLEWVGQATNRNYSLSAHEESCAANGAHQCLFYVRPA
ncbi:MAG: 4-vinyl reductase [Rhodospirillaceae bacterium]|nr:4-vinyl reductase [Rhodospirillaceae bacterium]